MDDSEFILYIILRGSLHLDTHQTNYCIANAVQHIMLKYFTLQVLSVKAHINSNNHLSDTSKWLATCSKKRIISVNDDVWDKLKAEFNVGKDVFCLKNEVVSVGKEIETTLIMWPSQYNNIPNYLKH